MKDRGTVVSTKDNTARVEVNCLEACQGCAASSLCIGQKNATGLLSVRNPVRAQVGDRVRIAIPEANYNKALIFLFGVLLLAILIGMGVGYVISPVLPLSSLESSIFGIVLGVMLSGIALSIRFKKLNDKSLYPEIIEILDKGGCYE